MDDRGGWPRRFVAAGAVLFLGLAVGRVPVLAIAALVALVLLGGGFRRSMWAHVGPRGRARAAATLHVGVLAFLWLYAAAAVLFLLAGLAPALARAIPPFHDALHRWGATDDRTAQVVAQDLAFDTQALAVPEGGPVTIEFTNLDLNVRHNISIYRIPTRRVAEAVFIGPIIRGRASISYHLRAPPPGRYEFACDVHPFMRGSVDLVPARPAGTGGGGPLARLAERIAVASHGSFGAEQATGLRVVPWGQIGANYLFSAISVILAIVLIRQRARDPVARLLAVGMLGTAAVFNAQAHFAFDVLPGGATELAHETFHLISGLAFVLGLLLFPDGKFAPGIARRRWLTWPLRAAAITAVLIGFFVASSFHGTDPGGYVAFFGVVIPAAGVVSQGFRFRRASTPEERQQSRILMWALVIVGLGSLVFAGLVAGFNAIEGTQHAAAELDRTVFLVFPLVFSAVPLALVVVLVRYRLWDVERVLNKALVYGVLAAFISAVYVVIVVGVGRAVGSGDRQNLGLSILATAAVAVAFQPLRTRLQRLANVLVYGRRATPYEVLADFSERMAGALSIEEVLPRMAEAAARGVDAEGGGVTLFIPGGRDRTVRWPEVASGSFSDAVPVTHRGEPVGEISVAKRPDEPLTSAERELLTDLASQAGLALRNVRLTLELQQRLAEISTQAEELRASRQRIVAAQDAAARRLQRDLHDGAQQQLVALAVKLGLAQELMATEPAMVESVLAELQVQTQEALQNLRDLARGIYPPVLLDHGLVAAIRAYVAKSALPAEVRALGVGRHPQEIEGAVYFCCTEALQNVAKYARCSAAVVTLEDRDGELRFFVEDDGVGFSVEGTPPGTGLQNMTDRIAAVGGTLDVASEPGRGTSVTGRVPSRAPQPVG